MTFVSNIAPLDEYYSHFKRHHNNLPQRSISVGLVSMGWFGSSVLRVNPMGSTAKRTYIRSTLTVEEHL